MKFKTWELALAIVVLASDDLRVRLFSMLDGLDVNVLIILFAILVYTQRKSLGVSAWMGGGKSVVSGAAHAAHGVAKGAAAAAHH